MLISKFDNTNIKQEVEKFEKKYNFTFPNIYKSFLLKYNGGETPNTDFKIKRISSDIRAFYGFGKADQYYHFNLIENDNQFQNWIKNNIIPIATNVSGDYIIIGIGKDNKGKIFFCYHDRPYNLIINIL